MSDIKLSQVIFGSNQAQAFDNNMYSKLLSFKLRSIYKHPITGMILGTGAANERQRYTVISSVFG